MGPFFVRLRLAGVFWLFITGKLIFATEGTEGTEDTEDTEKKSKKLFRAKTQSRQESQI